MKKPHILIIENSIAVTGALKSVLKSSSSLKNYFDFSVLLPAGSRVFGLVKGWGFSTHELAMRELRKSFVSWILYLPMLFMNIFRLKQCIKKERIDFIVCNDFYNLLPAMNKFLFGKTDYICYVRFLPTKFPKILVRLWFGLHSRYAKKIIAVSEAVKRELPESEKVIIIYDALPDEKNDYDTPLSTIILYPGNYIQGKGQEYALKAFAKIHVQFPQWTLRFVGGDMGLEKNRRYKKCLMALSKNLDIVQQVEWLDFRNDLTEDYSRAAIVLNFSDSESFSLTCLEALYFGRPVIATRCGGPEEIIDDHQTGILVPVQDTEAMASALKTLMRDAILRQKMGYDAYTIVRKKFTSENTIKRLQFEYLECLGGGA